MTTGLSSDAVQRLVDAHREFLSFVEKRVENRAVAEDILQSAFVRGIERGGELQNDENAVAWFYRILRNAIIDHYRHRSSAERAMEGWLREAPAHELPEAELKNEICRCMSGILESLKPEYRQAIEVVDIEEHSLNELAAAAGISAGNAAVRVHRAREALRKQVRTACGTCAEHGCLDCRCGGPSCATL